MRKIGKKKLLVAGAAVALVATGGGVAFAYWSTSGSGTGTAGTGTDSGVTVTQVGTVSGLVPGGTAQPVDFKITNPASTKQYISAVTYSISSINAPASTPTLTCTADDFTLVQPNAISQDLASGATTFSPSGATIAMKDLSTNQDGCKGATVNLAFSAS